MQINYKPLFLFLFFIVLSFFTKVHGQSGKIYSIFTVSGYHKQIISFDFPTNVDSTLFDLYDVFGDFHPQNYYSSFDPYGGRYFIGGSCDSLSFTRLFIYDLASNSITTSAPMTIGDIDYDVFNNRLILQIGNDLYSYNLSNGISTFIASLPSGTSIAYGTTRAFDPFNQQYLFHYGDSIGYHVAMFDLINLSLMFDTTLNSNQLPLMLVFDLNSKKYYSMVNNGDIVSFDPNTCTATPIVTITDWQSTLNQQQAVFDYNLGLYIVPYMADGNISKVATIDVNNNSIISNVSYPASDFNKYFSSVNPFMRVTNNQLLATYASNYQWYLNGNAIVGATSQLFVATQSGNYQVSESIYDGSTVFSDSILIVNTGVDASAIGSNILNVYPNPFSSHASISISNSTDENFTINIFNSFGALTKRQLKLKSNKLIIEKQELSNGLYYFQIENSHGIAGIGRFIIE